MAEQLSPLTEKLLNVPMTADQRQAVNQEVQRLLVRLSNLGLQLGNAPVPTQDTVSEVRDRLKNALAASQRAVRADRIAQADQEEPSPAASPPPTVSSPPPAAWSFPITHDLGPPGKPDVVSLGPEIAALQQILQRLGMGVPVSGHYDIQTVRAVKRLQTHHKLARRDGVVNADVRELLQRLSAGKG